MNIALASWYLHTHTLSTSHVYRLHKYVSLCNTLWFIVVCCCIQEKRTKCDGFMLLIEWTTYLSLWLIFCCRCRWLIYNRISLMKLNYKNQLTCDFDLINAKVQRSLLGSYNVTFYWPFGGALCLVQIVGDNIMPTNGVTINKINIFWKKKRFLLSMRNSLYGDTDNLRVVNISEFL